MKASQRLECAALTVLLFVAGLWHLVRPDDFVRAIPGLLSSWAYPVVIATGLVELTYAALVGAGTLWPHHPSLRRMLCASLWQLALYFAVLLWSHIEVSARGVEVFGIESQGLLWARTLLQLPLIAWTYRLYRRVLSLPT